MPPVSCPLTHRFTPGLYSRAMFIPAGTVVTSAKHRTAHQFAVLTGSLSVWSEQEQRVRYDAGQIGITRPGTRRICYAHADTVFVTFHATRRQSPEKVAKDILVHRLNPLLKNHVPMHQVKGMADSIIRYKRGRKCLSQ